MSGVTGSTIACLNIAVSRISKLRLIKLFFIAVANVNVAVAKRGLRAPRGQGVTRIENIAVNALNRVAVIIQPFTVADFDLCAGLCLLLSLSRSGRWC